MSTWKIILYSKKYWKEIAIQTIHLLFSWSIGETRAPLDSSKCHDVVCHHITPNQRCDSSWSWRCIDRYISNKVNVGEKFMVDPTNDSHLGQKWPVLIGIGLGMIIGTINDGLSMSPCLHWSTSFIRISPWSNGFCWLLLWLSPLCY